jgi:hypothetical protein
MAKVFSTVEDVSESEFFWESKKLRFLHLSEAIAFSWPFAVLSALYSIINLRLGLAFVNTMQEQYSSSLISTYLPLETFHLQKVTLISIMLTAILFPLSAWFFVKFWKVITLMAISLYSPPVDQKGLSDRVERAISFTLSSHVFLVVPIIGVLFKRIAFFVLLFASLKENIKLNTFQSLTVLLAPLILIGFFIAFLGTLLSLYINII